MYKLILVDDEADVREGLVDQLDWDSLGFEIVETAENGREAAEMMEKMRADVVVTDIQMPFMNGLQLAEWIRERFPSTRIIILTGFEEFEYAQKAIRLQIDEYILKPFSSKDLEQILIKVRSEIDEELQQRENVELLKEHYRQNLPLLQALFLSTILTHPMSEAEIISKCDSYKLNLDGHYFAVSLLSLDRISNLDQESSENSGPAPEGHIWLRETEDKELQRFAVLNIAQEILDQHQMGYAFMDHNEVVLLMFSGERDSKRFQTQLLQLLEEVRFSVERYLKLTVTIGVGMSGSKLSQMPTSLIEARQALDYRILLGSNKVIWIGDVEQKEKRSIVFDQQMEQQLVRQIKLGNDEELKRLMDDLFDEMMGSWKSYSDYQLFTLEMLTTLVKTAKELDADLDAMFGDGNGLAAIAGFTQAEEAKAWFTAICLRLRQFIATDRQSGYKRIIEDAKQYVKAHYADEDLSIGRLCQHLHISTGYFSNIFKKETKTTFVNYLLGIRMEVAQELLTMTDLKAFEIAEKVGFSDPNYFSFCFKKRFGQSPKEFRNSVTL